MRQTNAQLLAEQKPLGVIDALTAGFEVVRQRPWTLLVPVLLDLVIWWLPRLSLTAMFRPAVDEMFPTNGVPADMAQSAQELHDAASQFIGSLNLLGLVTGALDSVARVPTLLAFEAGNLHSPITALAYTAQLANAGVAVLLFLPLFLLGLFAAAVYIEMIAQGVRPLAEDLPLAWVVRVCMLWLRLIVFSLILGLALLASAIVLMLAGLFTPLGGDAGSLVTALVAVGWFWLTIYFFFVTAALAINQVGVIQAIRRSVLVFRVHFWSSLLLIGLTIFLEWGLGLVWSGIVESDLGSLFVVFAILANAGIGTGLLAASMIFYQDRLNYTERMIARARVARR